MESNLNFIKKREMKTFVHMVGIAARTIGVSLQLNLSNTNVPVIQCGQAQSAINLVVT